MHYGYLVCSELGKNHKMVCQISLYIKIPNWSPVMHYGYLVCSELGKNHKMVCQISLYIQNI